jgi:PST family polysaccharide transporter
LASVPVQSGNSPAGPADAGAATQPPRVGTRVLQNTIAQLVGRCAGLLFSAATSILLARFLGRERMGEYGAVYAYLALYTWIGTFGLEQILAREASQRRAEAASIFLTGTVVALCFSVSGIALALLLTPLFGYSAGLRILVLFAAVDGLVVPATSLVIIVFQVDMRQWYGVGLGLLRQAMWLGAVALLASGKSSIFWVILSRSLVGVVAAIITQWVCWRREVLPGSWSFSWPEARKLVGFGFPIALSTASVGVYHRIDQVMLHNMAGDHVLGPYVIAVQLIELVSALPVALMSSLFPVLSSNADDEPRFIHYLSTSYRLLLLVVFGLCAVMTPVAAPMIQLLYGKAYLATPPLLIVLIWSEVPVFFGVVICSALVARGLQRYLPLSTVVGAVTNVLLNLVVIPRYGALGSSWATVVSYCLASMLMFLCFPATRRLSWIGFRFVLPLFVCALVISLGTNALPCAFWWKLILAAITFPATAWMIGILRSEEIQRTISFLRGFQRA